MAHQDLTDRSAVMAAIAEFDRIGRDRFLSRYGFGPVPSDYVENDDKF